MKSRKSNFWAYMASYFEGFEGNVLQLKINTLDMQAYMYSRSLYDMYM